MSNRKLILAPLLIVLAFFIHFICDYFYFVRPGVAIRQVLTYGVITILLYYAGNRFFKDRERFIAAFCCLLFFFLYFGSLADTVQGLRHILTGGWVEIKMIALFALPCILMIGMCMRIRRGWVKLVIKFWVLYSLALIGYDLCVLLFSQKPERKYLSTPVAKPFEHTVSRPDVYIFIMDMYPSDTVLKKFFSYDNSTLRSFLRQKKFFVTGNSRSLYKDTYFAMPSTFAMQPLPYMKDTLLDDHKKKWIALRNIRNELLPLIFTRLGYVVNNYSVFRLAQPSLLHFNLDYLDNILTTTTFFNRWYTGIDPDYTLATSNRDLRFIKMSWSAQIKKDLAQLDRWLNGAVDNKKIQQKPTFNYFHFMMPHLPTLYDSSGKENSIKDMYQYNGFERTNRNYIEYLKFANGRLQEYIDKIIAKTGGDAIIILQGDHGYREFKERYPEEARLGILNSIYLPGQNYQKFNDSMTPIQTFTQVLANQFGYTISRE